ncbi:MAG: hypothetical protein H6740_15330 [Alphaproteobacteria bacterium]|nr:hypothetical protein [Alphaproteobacteria bacterium]
MPLLSYLILLRPRVIEARAQAAQRLGLVPRAPSAWQVSLGVLRMWWRVLSRPESIGGSVGFPARDTPRARLLEKKAVRFFALTWERAIAPLDQSGLIAGRERILRHLLTAHHDGAQFAYDFELLRLHDEAPGDSLRALVQRAADVVEGRNPRADYLRDLVVYEGYHERLQAAAQRALAGEPLLTDDEAHDPDISLVAYLRWCAEQPATPGASWQAWRDGRLSFAPGPVARGLE